MTLPGRNCMACLSINESLIHRDAVLVGAVEAFKDRLVLTNVVSLAVYNWGAKFVSTRRFCSAQFILVGSLL